MQVCVVHPKAELQSPKKASMYASSNSPGAEEFGQYARFGYNEAAVKRHGMQMRVQKKLGQVWQPGYEGMLQQAGLQGKQHTPCCPDWHEVHQTQCLAALMFSKPLLLPFFFFILLVLVILPSLFRTA